MVDDTVTSPPPPPSSAPVPLGSGVISLVNRLQDIFSRVGSQSAINLPQVAVVGSQSSGKSSVLEALVGRDFLPRGNEICTRRPLVLQLVRSSEPADEYGEFLHLPGKRFYDFSDIRREIQAETDREAGDNKGVSDRQIRLKIVSPNVLDMTLVDLPGITKVPVGDQPSDIEARIRTMIMSYIKEPSCLILAVTPANSDLANSDALQMAGVADPEGNRTIGVITKLDIMDRGTDARNLLQGKVIPLRLGYVGVVNRSQEDIQMNRSIKDALVAEEKFFRSRPVYSGLADSCGIPQLAKKLNQILAQHIKALLPGLRAHISTNLVTVAKEHASYGEITESKAGQGALLLNILSKYCEAFSSMVDGKNEEMSTSELSGGARIHYIFQSIFVRSLEEVDPCEGLTDDDIRTAIQNATGPRSALFVPEVPFEVLVRRQISRLLDPSLQCARFIYDELIKMSHRCMVTELQRFPFLRKRMDEVIGNFLREGLEPSENMIAHIMEMEMDYINTSHPNFIGGSKALEIAVQQTKSSRAALSLSRPKDALESEKGSASERTVKSRAILARQANGVVVDPAVRAVSDAEKIASSGNIGGSSWGISSIFGGGDKSARENVASKQHAEPFHSVEVEQSFSMIHLTEPPTILRPSDSNSETEAVEITVTKLLLKSYYDIVRKNVEDFVPKAIMHFLVNNTKRELHNVFIKKLYRDNLFEEMLQEPDEIASKRKRCRELLRAYQQAFKDLEELPMEAETLERGYSLPETTGLPKIHGLPTSSMYSTNSSGDYYGASPKHPKSKRSSHSGELQSPFYANADSNGNGKQSASGFYPTLDT
ncbi:putative dynamin central domain, dynamin, GTPase domain, GTPase effector domain, Dynamin superfamily [Medicago truncatula]|uniref:Dynamin 3A-like protein n=1 Tax=Medicago truncatula TaxID=3880 RepID=G7IS66_MEDTR|nr:dynamin-related protein 3B [Medicago truncatula]AES63527.1 dynamin 3A-like protein [Medicago truncatula]RHN71701.1 putative dynamin central domain, dynamin, GTPase domain, GTPase effector domain, Dynamin superfamily [Medicago truncatula]